MTEPLLTAFQLLRNNQPHNVWKKYCGFLDLSLKEFMEIQKRLLLEQIKLMGACELGKHFFKNRVPLSIEDFIDEVPLTVYEDYRKVLDKDRSFDLPAQPVVWSRSSGRSDEKKFKWVPYSREMLMKIGEFAIASFILASCDHKGDLRLGLDDTCLYTLAPAPYFTGVVADGIQKHINFKFLPSFDLSGDLDFNERIKIGFQEAFFSGIDFFYGLSSVLVKVGQQLGSANSGTKLSLKMLQPSCIWRILKALIIKTLARRPLLPKDLWQVKGIVAGGMDTSFYIDKIEELWGKKPLEGYGGTEMGGVAIQAWNRKGMTFLVDANFLEFIPEEDFYNMQDNPNFKPQVYRLDQVKEGVYELVVTNFNGGIFTRYKTGDLVRIIALEDEELGIKIPQMVFHARADGVIDLNGVTRLTEKQVWSTIESLGIAYTDWCIRKEYTLKKPLLHLYVELAQPGTANEFELTRRVNEKLRNEDSGYDWMMKMIESDPLEVTILNPGSFGRYIEERQKEGADLAHIKPPHVNASDAVIERLCKISSAGHRAS
jgi:hypothetical protein